MRDLLDIFPQLGDLDPATQIGFAPLPGTERVVSGHELALLARRQGPLLQGLHGAPPSDLHDVCIVRAMQSLSTDAIRAALMAGLGIPDAELDILEIQQPAVSSGPPAVSTRFAQPATA